MSIFSGFFKAMVAKEKVQNQNEIRNIYNFKGLNVIDIKENLSISTEVYDVERKLIGKSCID